jgi:excisionase family DNA binding protein
VSGDEAEAEVVMSVSDVARFLQIEEQTVRALARSGELPGVKLGKHWRFLRSELLRALRPVATALDPVAGGQPTAAPATISQEEAAALLGVNVRTIRRMVRGGRLELIETATGTMRLARDSVLRAAGQVYVGAPTDSVGARDGER